MKRAAALIFLLALSTAVFAAEPTYPVIVGLKGGKSLSVKSLALSFDPAEPSRNYRELGLVNAFAANLTASEIEALRKSPNVRYVEEDAPRYAFQLTPKPAALSQVTPYGIDLVRAKQAWIGGKGANINVVVIDSGVDMTHPDLAPLYAGGFNAFNTTAEPRDDNGHGTHVAGTIAGADNAIGVVGVAPQIRLWAAKVLNSEGSGSISNVIRALDFIIDKKTELGGNWIASLSLGSCRGSTAEGEAVFKAIDAGILVIAASGNHDPSLPDICEAGNQNNNGYAVSFPAAYLGVVAVAAIDSTQAVASFSNFGPEVSLAAPGVQVLSSVPVGSGAYSLMTPAGGTTVLAPPVVGSPEKDVTGSYVFCGLGKSGEFPASVAGKIALIKRGEITFKEKTKNAKAAGAAAVVIFNHSATPIAWTLIGKVDSTGKANPTLCDNPDTSAQCHDDPADLAFDWPLTVGISQIDGEKLVSEPKDSITINYKTKDDYGVESGTSMAAPHVAGAAAAVWSMAPGATSTAVKQALITTAKDLGDPGADSLYGAGLIDVEAAGKLLAPGAFSNGGTPQPSKPTGRVAGRRGH